MKYKYIDAEKLKAHIQHLIKKDNYELFDVPELLSFIDSLQQEEVDMGEISDGYHTFNELYYYRMLYNAAFFNLLPKEWVHKSKKHHTGEECFGGGWFIVMANLPTGQISNHYELKDWNLFQIPEKEFADEWDGHTPQEAAERLHRYLQQEHPIQINTLTWKDINGLERIINKVHYEFRNGIGEKSFGEEVLERFREEKDEQEHSEVDIINTDNYIQYANIEAGIKAHAETYSFNIESQLFPQLTKEQQALWRKEIEQACISGGEAGVELAKDMRYKENQQLDVDLEKEIRSIWEKCNPTDEGMGVESTYMHIEAFDIIARHFYNLGLNARKED